MKKNKASKLIRSLTIIMAFVLAFGSVDYVLAESAAHVEKTDVLVSFTGKPGAAEQTLIYNAGGKVKRNFHIVSTIAASVPKGKLDSLRRNPKVTSVDEDITV